jgi:hypothetical protein
MPRLHAKLNMPKISLQFARYMGKSFTNIVTKLDSECS